MRHHSIQDGIAVEMPSWTMLARLCLPAVCTAAILAMIAGPMLPAYAGGITWNQFRYGPAHNGFTPSGPSAASLHKLRLQWSRGSGGAQSDPVAGSLGQVFFSADGHLYAVDARDGHTLWSRRWSGLSDPAYYFSACQVRTCSRNIQTLYDTTTSPRSSLVAVNAGNDKIEWSYRVKDSSWPTIGGSSLPSDKQIVYVSSDGTLLAFRPQGGKPLWMVAPAFYESCAGPGPCFRINTVTPAVSGGRVYVTVTDGRLYAIGAKRGHVLWSSFVGSTWARTSIAVAGNHLLIAMSNGEIVAVSASNGKRQWTYPGRTGAAAHGILPGLGIAYGSVYLTGIGRQAHGAETDLTALNLSNGRRRWTVHADAALMNPSVANGVVYVGDSHSRLHIINARNGKSVATVKGKKGMAATYPAIVFNWVYVGNSAFESPD